MRKVSFIFSVLFSISLFSSIKSIDEITRVMQRNADKVKDMMCEVVMTMDLGKGGRRTQTMRLWMKGKDKITMEYGGNKIIINGDKMLMDTPQGERVINRDTQGAENPAPPGVDLQKRAGDFFKENNAKVVSQRRDKAVIEIIPKDKNPMMNRIRMVIDTERGLITEQRMYSNYGTTKMEMKYKKIGDAWVLSEIEMVVPTPQGRAGRMKVEYKNIRINQGISDKFFEIKEQEK